MIAEKAELNQFSSGKSSKSEQEKFESRPAAIFAPKLDSFEETEIFNLKQTGENVNMRIYNVVSEFMLEEAPKSKGHTIFETVFGSISDNLWTDLYQNRRFFLGKFLFK